MEKLNPFQLPTLRDLEWWQDVTLHDEHNSFFEELILQMDKRFHAALDCDDLASFRKEYISTSKTMVRRLSNEILLPQILNYSWPRIIKYYCYLRQRRKSSLSFLSESSSIVKWTLDKDLILNALAQADDMETQNITHKKFNVRSNTLLHQWVLDEYWPLVKRYCGFAAVPVIEAHTRCINSKIQSHGYKDRFKYHRFGNYHYDEDVYSLPLIIYLSEVGMENGPFEYLGASYRYNHNYILRAFHQAINHDCGISTLEDSSFKVLARLPSVFRGGDVFGNLYPETQFEMEMPTRVIGGVGTTVLFDGFNLIHSGGLPQAGVRKALFINFRFPFAKLISKWQNFILGKQLKL